MGAAVVAGDGAGVGMVDVVRCGAVAGGAVVVARFGAVMVVWPPGGVVVDSGGRVVVVVGLVVDVVDVGIVTWLLAGDATNRPSPTNSMRSPELVHARRIRESLPGAAH